MRGVRMSKVIFLDIDGTLLDHERYLSVPFSANEAVKRAQYNGHKIIICTGRAKSGVHPKLLRFTPDARIFGAGSTIEYKDERIFSASIPNERLKVLASFMEERNFGYVFEGEYDSYRNPIAADRFDRMHNERDLDPVHQRILTSDDNYYNMDDCDINEVFVNKMTIFAPSIEAMNEFKETFGDEFHIIVYDWNEEMKQIGAEVLVKGISKAQGMDVMLEVLGATLEDSIAFGDSMNDLEMIRHANIGVAMGNACDTLKQQADRVCECCWDDGIYREFERLGLI